MELMISVIIPAYNPSEESLQIAISSIEEQEYKDYEIIIVDDGSDDEHRSIIQKLADQTSNVKLITTENQGVSVARNIGVLQAKGDYITFLDADDALTDQFFCEGVKMIENTSSDFIVGGVALTEEISSFNPIESNTSSLVYRVFEEKG